MVQSFQDAAIIIVSSGIGAFIGAYLKKKGENYATKEDIGILVEQVAAVTNATKRIEGSITHEYRRWEIKKEVLFDLLEKYVRLEDALNRLIASTTAYFEAPNTDQGTLSDPQKMAENLTVLHAEFLIVALKVKVFCNEKLTHHVLQTAQAISVGAMASGQGRYRQAQAVFVDIRTNLLAKLTELVSDELQSLPKI
jgi:hypothetical protein